MTHHHPSIMIIPLFLLSVIFLPEPTRACTAILAGRLATTDNSVIVTHSDDGEGDNDPRIMYVPPRNKNGGKREVCPDTEDYPRYVGHGRGKDYFPERLDGDYEMTIPIGFIDEIVGTTHGYFDGNYGIINDQQLITGGESTCSGIFASNATSPQNNGHALFSINELSRIALERTKTARQAIHLMGNLAETYGFYGASGSFEGSAETLLVADPMEGFVFHVLPDDTGKKAVWVAKRVPDEEVTVVANMFTIREVDLEDDFNFIGSDYMYQVAKRNHLWKEEDGLLDFTKVFSDGEYASKYYSGRRMWGAFRMIAPSQTFDPTYDDLRMKAAYPWSVKPDKKMSVHDIFEIHRTFYQGTKYDLSGGASSGPFGDPDRFAPGIGEAEVQKKYDGRGAWERSIALYRTTYTTVLQARSKFNGPIGALMWLGLHAAHGTCFVPFSMGVKRLPKSVTYGRMTNLDRKSAFWAFRYVHTITKLRYEDLSKIRSKAQRHWENEGHALQNHIDNSTLSGEAFHPEELSTLYENHLNNVLDAWWDMVDQMVFRYADGFDNSVNGAPAIGYPSVWLEDVGYQNGPPPPKNYGPIRENDVKKVVSSLKDQSVIKYALFDLFR